MAATYPPRPIVHRDDGAVTFTGRCDQDGTCQLVALRTTNDMVQLAFHGAQRHSIHLTRVQQAALSKLLTGPTHDDQETG